jgi:hypothetical protein
MRSLDQLDRWMAGKVKDWTSRISGRHGKELLEARREILEDVRSRMQPKGAGKSVFPHTSIDIRIAAQDEQERAVCEAAFAGEDGIEQDIREMFAEAGCGVPRGFQAKVEVVEDSGLAWSERPFRIEYSSGKTPSAAKSRAGAERPSAKLIVTAGNAASPECEITTDRFYLGRLAEVVGEREGLRRRNDLAFAEIETTVSREHACIRYDRELGAYRIFDTHSQRGTFVLRGGRRIDVPRGAAAGVQLKSGDEIHLGNARVRFEEQES